MTVLASGSAIRRALLEGVGLAFTVERPMVDEPALKRDFAGTTEAMAAMLAEAKALEISIRSPGEWVIGSDSIAECRGVQFDKPADRAQAAENLSGREREVLDCLSQGFLYKEIAEKLGISYETVHTYIRRVYEKLQVRTRTQAVAKFLQR